MATEEHHVPGYQILSILLLDSTFTRISQINFGDSQILTNVDVTNDYQLLDEAFVSEVRVKFSLKIQNTVSVSAEVKMVGSFKIIGSPELPVEEFAKINAPAIIYPYVREHLSMLSLKAGIGQVLLPPFNFIKKKQEVNQ